MKHEPTFLDLFREQRAAMRSGPLMTSVKQFRINMLTVVAALFTGTGTDDEAEAE